MELLSLKWVLHSSDVYFREWRNLQRIINNLKNTQALNLSNAVLRERIMVSVMVKALGLSLLLPVGRGLCLFDFGVLPFPGPETTS